MSNNVQVSESVKLDNELHAIAIRAYEHMYDIFHDVVYKPVSVIQSFEPVEDSDIWTFVDLTVLKPTAVPNDIINLCQKAQQLHCATVCVNPNYIELAANELRNSMVKPICVAGFPLANATNKALIAEMQDAENNGAKEIDIVLPAGLLIAKTYITLYNYLLNAIASVDVPVKVILETCSHTKDDIAKASILSIAAGAAFIKTSTGFGSAGATLEDVSLMRLCAGDRCGVKASGGIRTLSDARAMLKAGANRIGASGLG